MELNARTIGLAALVGVDAKRLLEVLRDALRPLMGLAAGLAGGAGCGLLGLLLLIVPSKYVRDDLGLSGAYLPLEILIGVTGLYFAVGTLGSLTLSWRWLKNSAASSADPIVRAFFIFVTTAVGILSIFWLTALLDWTPLPPLLAIALFFAFLVLGMARAS